MQPDQRMAANRNCLQQSGAPLLPVVSEQGVQNGPRALVFLQDPIQNSRAQRAVGAPRRRPGADRRRAGRAPPKDRMSEAAKLALGIDDLIPIARLPG